MMKHLPLMLEATQKSPQKGNKKKAEKKSQREMR